jgi:uroporphyrinogen decarboxylase
MNNRTRFHRIMNFEAVDRIPVVLGGPWPDTMARWVREGYPEGTPLHDYFEVEPFTAVCAGPNTGVYPPLPTRVIEDHATHVIKTDGYGRTIRDFKNHTSMPEWIDFPVKTPGDLERYIRDHFDPDRADERWPDDWEEKARAWDDSARRDTLLFVDGGCYYWTLRSLAGVETASYLFYDAPELVDRLFENINRICLRGIERAASRLDLDYLGFGEDIAFKTGTLVSPEMFERFILPRYRRSVDAARRLGLSQTWYDTDGDFSPFLDLYLDVGIDTFAPLEVAAGMDPVALRRRCGRRIRMLGGVDKREIARGPAAIDRILEHLSPIVSQGGYIPYIDHSVSSDISLADYRYFIAALKQLSVGPPVPRRDAADPDHPAP